LTKPTNDPESIIRAIRRTVAAGQQPSVSLIAASTPDPFRILVSTIISLRTRDEVTKAASERLFARADTPAAIAALSEETIAKLIYPAGFYRTKAKNIGAAARAIVELGGAVPKERERLLQLPGVGVKTANLTLSLGYGRPYICVDIHVHRVSNRLGWVETKKPEETEADLMVVLPRRHWIEINGLLVAFGQRVCTPQSPRCSICPVADRCPRIGVSRSR
jgi:endonuclease III